MVYKLAHEAESSSLPSPVSGKLYDNLLEFLLVLVRTENDIAKMDRDKNKDNEILLTKMSVLSFPELFHELFFTAGDTGYRLCSNIQYPNHS